MTKIIYIFNEVNSLRLCVMYTFRYNQFIVSVDG